MKIITIAILSLASAAFLTSTEDLRIIAAEAMEAHAQAQTVQIQKEAELSELTAAARTQAGVVRDARITTQLAADEAARALAAYLEWLNSPLPNEGRPGEDLDWHVREKPTPDQFDWIVEGNAF